MLRSQSGSLAQAGVVASTHCVAAVGHRSGLRRSTARGLACQQAKGLGDARVSKEDSRQDTKGPRGQR